MKTSLYRKHTRSGHNPMVITKLLTNYRSHEAILEIPNKLFYDGELRCSSGKAKLATINKIKWLPSTSYPVIFRQVQ